MPDTQKKTAMKNGSPRGFLGLVGVQGEVEEVVGMLWMCPASTKMAGVHGAAVELLPVSTMDAAAPMISEKNEDMGKLDLGLVNSTEQRERERREGVCHRGELPDADSEPRALLANTSYDKCWGFVGVLWMGCVCALGERRGQGME